MPTPLMRQYLFDHLLLNRVHQIDALELCALLPDNSVNCIVTSPPYFGLRDYGVEGQIGLEETPAQYVAKLVAVFREARRVLRDDGTLWINLGDSYVGATSQHKPGEHQGFNSVISSKTMSGIPSEGRGDRNRAMYEMGLGMKQRLMIPARVAIALQDDGWILRDEIVWHKPAPMPESVKDRTTKAHEMIYMLAKSARYYYNADAIREPYAVNENDKRPAEKQGGKFSESYHAARRAGRTDSASATRECSISGRNRRSVWTVNTEPSSVQHYAMFPTKLIEPMILAGCPRGGVVLDMFMGAGTTAYVARMLGRNYVGGELNGDNVAITRDRLRMPFERRHVVQNDRVDDLPLFAGIEAR